MKKILLCASLLAVFAAGFAGCSQRREWNREERKAMRDALRSYRQMIYLDDLTDSEFVLFSDGVAGELENAYPVYTSFIQMPGVNDTVDMFVVTTIVEELDADAHNMRHIFPYDYLVGQGVLPAGPQPAESLLHLPGRQGERDLLHDGAVLQRRAGRHDRPFANAPAGGTVRRRAVRLDGDGDRRHRKRPGPIAAGRNTENRGVPNIRRAPVVRGLSPRIVPECPDPHPALRAESSAGTCCS